MIRNNRIGMFYSFWFITTCTKFVELTGKDLIVQITEFVSGAYLQLPTVVLNFGVSASVGTGMIISTLLAVDLLLN